MFILNQIGRDCSSDPTKNPKGFGVIRTQDSFRGKSLRPQQYFELVLNAEYGVVWHKRDGSQPKVFLGAG
jgi:hypothetical protein